MRLFHLSSKIRRRIDCLRSSPLPSIAATMGNVAFSQASMEMPLSSFVYKVVVSTELVLAVEGSLIELAESVLLAEGHVVTLSFISLCAAL